VISNRPTSTNADTLVSDFYSVDTEHRPGLRQAKPSQATLPGPPAPRAGQAAWSAAAFARLKSIIVTGMKNPVRFIRYGIEVVRAKLRGERLPVPLAATPDTS